MKKRKTEPAEKSAQAVQLRSGNIHPFSALRNVREFPQEAEVYRSMREAIPILDAAVGKLVRLTGGFEAQCADRTLQRQLNGFLRTVPVGRGQTGIENFLSAYLESLLTYGRAVGEMVVCGRQLQAVLWGDVTSVAIQEGDSPLDFALGHWENGELKIFPRQNLLLFSTWGAGPDAPYGASLFRSMPFLADVLLKIYNTVGLNWERAGNLRYSVVYKPTTDADRELAGERSSEIAREWSQAMQDGRNGQVRDFVAVGDVEIKVIGADGKVLDSEVPVRQILEQLVAKTGLPPFLLGLSWSSTERMSAQQTDLLTSELWAIRRSVEPVLNRICRLWMQLHGSSEEARIVWDEISLQDTVEQAHAALYSAQADKIRRETEQ